MNTNTVNISFKKDLQKKLINSQKLNLVRVQNLSEKPPAFISREEKDRKRYSILDRTNLNAWILKSRLLKKKLKNTGKKIRKIVDQNCS